MARWWSCVACMSWCRRWWTWGSRCGGRGRGWIFRLEDGSLWEQIELRDQLSRDPRAGQPIVIRRAALGSFRAEVDGMRPIRVSRRE